MGVSKTELFKTHHNQLAGMAKALGHPARIAIMEVLMNNGACYCGDIVDELPLSQSTVSQHLKALKEAGILKVSNNGAYSCYCLDSTVCQRLISQFTALFRKMTKCC